VIFEILTPVFGSGSFIGTRMFLTAGSVKVRATDGNLVAVAAVILNSINIIIVVFEILAHFSRLHGTPPTQTNRTQDETTLQV
jgi:hypothetical protein